MANTIDPAITRPNRSARRCRQHRQRTGHHADITIIAGNYGNCNKCGLGLSKCSSCYGDHNCTPCNNTGYICPNHGGYWQ